MEMRPKFMKELLGYFRVVSIHTIWDPGLLNTFSIDINSHTWDPGWWLYIFIANIEGNAFLKGMECWDIP